MARAINWARYDRLKAQGHSERDIAGALGIPRTTLRRELQKREGPPSTVDRGRAHVSPSTVGRPPSEISAAVSAALQPLLARLEALEAAVEGRPAGAEPSTVHRPRSQRPPSPPDTSTVHPATVDPEAWELRQAKHSVRWTIYVPRAMQEEIKRRAAAAGRNPSLLVQQALRRWLAEEEP
jgi:hypothetical protein